MKQSDLSLPRDAQARIEAADTLIAFCKTQLRHPDSALVVAFAEISHELTLRLVKVREDARASLNTDNPEAAVAAGAR